MDRKNLVIACAAGVLVGAAVLLGIITDKETAWRAFQIVFTFLMGG